MELSTDIGLQRRLLAFSTFLGAVLMLLGTLALVGWQWDIEFLKRPVEGTVAMNPTTAVCFLLCASSILIGAVNDKYAFVSIGPAVIAACIGLSKLIALIIGSDYGIDAYLFAEKLNSETGLVTRNRMAPNTALCFLITGSSLVLYRAGAGLQDKATLWAEVMAVTLFLLGVVSMIGYVYQIKEFYGVMSYIPMAVQTAVGFLLLATAILFANPQGRFMVSLTGSLSGSYALRLLLPFALLAPIGLGFLRVTGQRAGLFSPEFGTMIHVTLEIVLFVLLIWRVAIVTNRNDREKIAAELALSEMNALLEARVKERTAELRLSVRELVENEERNRRMAERFSTMVAASNTGAWEYNEQTGFLWCSEEYFSMLGYDASEFDMSGTPNLAQTWTDLLHPDDRSKPDPHFSESLRKAGAMYENTFRMRHKDGRYLWILSRGRTLKDSSGRATAITVGTHIDITARKLAEEELAASEERYRNTLDNMLEGVQVIGPNFEYLYINKTLEKQGGYSWEQLKGRTMPEMYPGLEQSEVYQVIASCLHDRTVRHLETHFIFPDGSSTWFELSIQPVPEGVFMLSIDITERKKAEAELAASEERLRYTMDNMQEGAQIISHDWRYLYMNNTMEKHGGFPREQVIGRPAGEVYPGLEQTHVYSEVSRCMSERVPRHFETHFTFPDGSSTWFEISVLPIPEGVFLLTMDVSEKKQAELEIHRLNEGLERTVEQRTAQLHAVNKELEAFSYSVSHDLRAPLRAINGFSDMVVNQYGPQLDDNAKRLLGIIRDNAVTMGQLIDDLLEFSRTGRKELAIANVDMTALAKEALAELTQNNPEKAKAVSIMPLPQAIGDRQLLKQVFINLISNALKYSSKVEVPEVTIWADDTDQQVTYHVKDNGAGFDMTYASKLFGVFQRLHSKREFDGTGVGLALVQRIITRHGGQVWAEAEVDKGATFHFSLPISIQSIHEMGPKMELPETDKPKA